MLIILFLLCRVIQQFTQQPFWLHGDKSAEMLEEIFKVHYKAKYINCTVTDVLFPATHDLFSVSLQS